jgi:hypothetical protein
MLGEVLAVQLSETECEFTPLPESEKLLGPPHPISRNKEIIEHRSLSTAVCFA